MISQSGFVGVSGGGMRGKMIRNTSVKWICKYVTMCCFFFLLIKSILKSVAIKVYEMYESL